MTTITVLSAKGGASKTTLALTLAASAPASPLVIDTDPSESAARWAAALGLDSATARSATALRGALRASKAEIAVVDTPPLYEDESVVQAAIDAADAVLVPLNPSPADIDRLALITPLLQGKTWSIVVTQERAYTRLGAALRDQLAEAELPVLTTGIPSREATRVAWGSEAPDPLAGKMLWAELIGEEA